MKLCVTGNNMVNSIRYAKELKVAQVKTDAIKRFLDHFASCGYCETSPLPQNSSLEQVFLGIKP